MIDKNNHEGAGHSPHVLRLQIRVGLQQETADFKVAQRSGDMQWGALTEEKRKSQHAQAEFVSHQKNSNDDDV